MKALAALLLLGAALFVVVVMAPQVHQLDRGSVDTAAISSRSGVTSDPVDANALFGTWAVDGEAAWAMTIRMPRIAKALVGQTPEKIAKVKAFFMAKIVGVGLQFTATKVIRMTPGTRLEGTYTITSRVGNVFTVDCPNQQGKVSLCKATVTPDRLEMFDIAKPDEVIVFNRIR